MGIYSLNSGIQGCFVNGKTYYKWPFYIAILIYQGVKTMAILKSSHPRPSRLSHARPQGIHRSSDLPADGRHQPTVEGDLPDGGAACGATG